MWLFKRKQKEAVPTPFWLWMPVESRNYGREIGVENDCTGSPKCVAAVHIRDKQGGFTSLEAHLNSEEVQWLIDRLQESQRIYANG